MSDMRFDRSGVLGDGIKELERRQLCELASELCALIRSEAGANGYRGGIYPDNITVSESGELSIGPATESGWKGQELGFLAPELYWQGTPGPAADVYSLGLLLYYAAAGSLPFEGEDEDAFLKRMSGKPITAPESAGKKLGAIIEKAASFDAADRYPTVAQLKLMLDDCVSNPYLGGKPGEKAVFNKDKSELSELELMMLSIIDAGGESDKAAETDKAGDAAEAEDVVEAEELVEDGEVEKTVEVEEAAARPQESAADAADTQPELPELMLTPEVDETEYAALPPEPETDMTDEPIWDTPFNGLFNTAELKDTLKNEPEPDKTKDNIFATEELKKPEVVTLKEEKNPELEPAAAKPVQRVQSRRQASAIPAVQYTKNLEREKQIAAEVRKRRSSKPTAVILVLCAALVMVAIVFNAMRQDILDAQRARNPEVTPAPTASAAAASAEPEIVPDDGVAAPDVVSTAEPTQESAAVSRYEVFVEDVSWTEARGKCNALGGHLVVVSDEAEFEEVCRLAQEYNISRVWVGAHRIDGTMVWETTEQVNFYQWGDGEPSYSDSADGAAEDYMLLWYHRGWVYNDSRNDPAGEFPQWYSGTIGYICEYYE